MNFSEEFSKDFFLKLSIDRLGLEFIGEKNGKDKALNFLQSEKIIRSESNYSNKFCPICQTTLRIEKHSSSKLGWRVVCTGKKHIINPMQESFFFH